jgi:hypothetical protein
MMLAPPARTVADKYVGIAVTTRRIRPPLSPRIAEPAPSAVESLDPIVQHETGGWSVWHDVERFPSHAFALAVWVQRNQTFRGLQ